MGEWEIRCVNLLEHLGHSALVLRSSGSRCIGLTHSVF